MFLWKSGFIEILLQQDGLWHLISNIASIISSVSKENLSWAKKKLQK